MVICLLNELCDFAFVYIPDRKYLSSIYLFQASGFRALRFKICDSTFLIKMLAKETAMLVPIYAWLYHVFGGSFFPVNWNEFS